MDESRELAAIEEALTQDDPRLAAHLTSFSWTPLTLRIAVLLTLAVVSILIVAATLGGGASDTCRTPRWPAPTATSSSPPAPPTPPGVAGCARTQTGLATAQALAQKEHREDQGRDERDRGAVIDQPLPHVLQ